MRFLLSVLASTFALNAATGSTGTPGRIQLLPFGEFESRDGRPGPGRKWRINDAQGIKIAAALNAIAAQTPIVIDYEHATLIAVPKGEVAPAAGWMNRFDWLSGQGLFSDVDWTPRAKASIDAKELRYISPVLMSDPDTDEVTGVAFAALTNFPGLLGMDEARVVSALNAFAATLTPPTEKNLMDRNQLIALLGLAATATDADITNAITALRAKPGIPGALITALGLPATADEASAFNAVTALKTGSSQTLDVVSQLTTQVAALTTQLNEGKLTALVDGAIAAGKFGPAHRDMLMNQGRTDFAALSAVIDKTAVIPGLLGQAGSSEERDKKDNVTALSANQKLVAKKLGISEDAYLKQLQAV